LAVDALCQGQHLSGLRKAGVLQDIARVHVSGSLLLGIQNTVWEGHKMENTVTPRILKTKHAARYVGISGWKFRNLVQAGEIPYIPGEGTSPWLFDKKDLDNWIERRKVTL
jgi:excisionase family DNA binding protein